MPATSADSGLPLGTLPTEARNSSTTHFDSLTPLERVQAMHRADQEAVAAVEAVLPQIAAAVESLTARMRKGGRLLYIGAGTSGRLGVLDASECPPTFHTPPSLVEGIIAGGEQALRAAVEGAEDDAGQGAQDLQKRGLRAEDCVVGIAASGRTPYVLGALAAARQAGALTIGLSCVPGSPVEQAAAFGISPLTGPEVLTGSTRLKAGTATKLVLNMLTTATLAGLGYVHGNLMVNVQPTNAKLRDRAVRIVADVAHCSRADAEDALGQADGEVKTAIVMRRLRIDSASARSRLAAVDGLLRGALEQQS